MSDSADDEIGEGSSPPARFRDRSDAGRKLAALLEQYRAESPVILALPRGGVPVGFEIARQLHAPLDIVVVRKVGVPWHRELGAGAVAEGGFLHLSADVVSAVGLTEEDLAPIIDEKRREVEARVRRFRAGRARAELRDRTVILVDDGIATGGTVRAALQAVKAAAPRQVVLAVPVASPEILESLAPEVDRIVCPLVPPHLHAIGLWYEDFGQVDDDEVVRLLEESNVRINKKGEGSHVARTLL
jgi:putative phosphoribosyl transferase